MNHAIHTLAASGDDPVKYIFGAIFVLIWVISSIMSVVAKKREQDRRQRVRETIQMERTLPPQLPLPNRTQRQPHAPPVMLRRVDS